MLVSSRFQESRKLLANFCASSRSGPMVNCMTTSSNLAQRAWNTLNLALYSSTHSCTSLLADSMIEMGCWAIHNSWAVVQEGSAGSSVEISRSVGSQVKRIRESGRAGGGLGAFVVHLIRRTL